MNETNQAILLLTVRFGASKPNEVDPLSLVEYGRLAAWLHKNNHEPRDLLRHPEEVLADWPDPKGKISKERIQRLLNRGMAMGVALEKWQGAGLWTLTRADSEYPKRLARQLGQNRPAVLFGAGNRSLLNAGGLAMVGSRDITEGDQAYTSQIAKQAANEGMNIVSGGARGVDEIAMKSALEVEGTALGILADGLLKKALSAKWRTYIKNRQLCLVSSFYPDAGWNTGNAMGRNKYIYCLSDYALVVQSTKGKGGTWAGATENLKNHYTKLFVRSDRNSDGLEALSKLGALPLSLPSESEITEEWLRASLATEQFTATRPPTQDTDAPAQRFYELFVSELQRQFARQEVVSLSDLKHQMTDLKQGQITDWLDRAEKESFIKRKSQKKREYELVQKSEDSQMALFGDSKENG